MIKFSGVGKEHDVCGLCSVGIEKKRFNHELLHVLLLALPAVCTMDFPLAVL